MSNKMCLKKSRRKFLKRLSAVAGAVIVPGLATEDALAIPIAASGATPKKKAVKRKVVKKKAVKKKAVKRKVAKKKAVKRKVVKKKVVKKKAVKRKVALKRRMHPYQYIADHTPHDSPPRGVPEPSTVGLVSIGVAAIALATRHKKQGKERKD